MLLIASYIAIQAVRALLAGSHAEASPFGPCIAAVYLLVQPPLGILKLTLGRRLESPALQGDGVLTLAAAALAVVTLVPPHPQLDAWVVVGIAGEASRVAIRHRFG